MKEQIAPHLERLKGLIENGDERAKEKIVALQIKVKQIDAVLPYLEKCITKNKEAEQKTIAILEKKRDEELFALEKGITSVNSSTDKIESDRKTSTSDLYMKVLAENDDMGENSQLNEAFGEASRSTNAVQHSTPLHEPSHTDIINSTPVQFSGVSTNVENAVINNNITPITHSHDYQENSTNSLDETIIAPASTVQEQPVPVVVEPYNLDTSLQTDVSRIPTVDASLQEPEQLTTLSVNPQSSVVEPRTRANLNSNKPPPIKPKKKKVPPPRPPRRSSSYLSDSIESQGSPISDTKQRSSVVSAGSPVAPQPPHRSSSYMSDNVGSPVPDTKQRRHTDHSVLNATATSSVESSVIPWPPRRNSSSYISESQGSPASDTRQQRQSVDHSTRHQRQSVDHSTANTTTELPAIPLRHSSGTISYKTSEHLGEDLANVSVFSKIKVYSFTMNKVY